MAAEAAFPDALPALTRLHWYVLERVLGQGGFGITYLAKDTNLDQRVAIKEYLPVEGATRLPDGTVHWRTDELRERYRWGLERFIQEARTLARFDHPNIVRVLSVFEFNGTAYMVMRFEEGGTLSALLDRRGTLPENDLLRLILPVLDGLELVHNAGFIHRDIKPDNIHIAGDGRPVLLDFGSARQSLGSSNTLTILVAPGYAPFEQYYSDPSSQGPWTDIYGLGATCYRIICGRAPLDAVSRSKGILGSTQETMVPASVVGAGRYSGAVLAAIDHALAFAEKDRPQSIAEWRKELTGDATAHRAAAPAAPATAPVVRAPTAQPAATILNPQRPSERTVSAAPSLPRTEPAVNATQFVPPAKWLSGFWKWTLGVAAIVVVGIGAYWMGRGNDNTQSKLDALEKQIKASQDAANAREKQQAEALQRRQDQDAIQRKAVEDAKAEQARVAENTRLAEKNAQTEAARKSEPAPRVQPDTSKRQEAPPKAPATARSTPAVTPPSAATPAPPQKTSVAKAPPSSTPPPAPETTSTAQNQSTAQPQVATAEPVKAAPPPPPAEKRPPTASEQIAEADRAMREQRYSDATSILRPLAEAGSAQAQERLADAYVEGRGVPRNLALAGQWYEKAGEQGVTNAQLKLGNMFASGAGVARNNNFAYVWYGIAASMGSSAGKTEQEKVGSLLQPAEREQADRVIASKIAGMKKP
jgi:serine/threonine protein kinase